MDEFKKYLQHHNSDIDLDVPRENVWNNIQKEITPVKKANVFVMYAKVAVAACVIGLAGVGVWHLIKGNEQQQQQIAKAGEAAKVAPEAAEINKDSINNVTPEQVTKEPEETFASTAKENKIKQSPSEAKTPVMTAAALNELQGVESSFSQVINLQRARVNTTPLYVESPAYFRDFKEQMKQMEDDEKGIKKDINKQGLKDELLDQLINIYQQKLNMLKQLQTEMNKVNNQFKQNHKSVDYAKTYFLNI
ncbi:hypothetical protein ACI6Q2_05260 [Chitinophagaceae bacterium LWZ2-11]